MCNTLLTKSQPCLHPPKIRMAWWPESPVVGRAETGTVYLTCVKMVFFCMIYHNRRHVVDKSLSYLSRELCHARQVLVSLWISFPGFGCMRKSSQTVKMPFYFFLHDGVWHKQGSVESFTRNIWTEAWRLSSDVFSAERDAQAWSCYFLNWRRTVFMDFVVNDLWFDRKSKPLNLLSP